MKKSLILVLVLLLVAGIAVGCTATPAASEPAQGGAASAPAENAGGEKVFRYAYLPFSLDMYLPALPQLSAEFGASAAATNITLTAFTCTYAISVILWGALADRCGRKPCLILGALFYAGSSLACVFSGSIGMLIAARAGQGIGIGAIAGTAVAIVKDCFSGTVRERMIARIYTVSSVAPIIAPLLGGQLLRFFSWRAAFVALCGLGLLTLALSVCFCETRPASQARAASAADMAGRYWKLIKNRAFFLPAVLFTVCNIPFIGYIAVSSYIYIDLFHLTAQRYSILFAFNSLLSIFGPSIYMRFFSRMAKKKVGTGFFLLSAASGAAVLMLGNVSPLAFLLAFMPFSLLYAGVYTFGLNLALEQIEGDTGAASSLLSFLCTIFGAIGTALASAFSANAIRALGVLILAFSLLPLAAWRLFLRSPIPCKGLQTHRKEAVENGEFPA